MKRRIISLSIAFLIVFTSTIYAKEDINQEYALEFYNIMEEILENYLNTDQDKEINGQVLYEAAMKGLFSELDAYSEFLIPSEEENFINSIEKDFIGIGIVLAKEDKNIVVKEVLENSPARDAGILAEDIIYMVDDVHLEGKTLEEVVNLIRGARDTGVGIRVLRQDKTIDFQVIRKKISLETITVKDLSEYSSKLSNQARDKVLYVEIESFASDTWLKFLRIIELAKKEGKEILLLDLRDNSGGYLNTALSILNQLVPEGDLLYIKDNKGVQKVYKSELKKKPFKEIVLLINENSASASEIVAGALKDRGQASLVGETTYGKGLAQVILDTDLGYSIKYTNQEFVTPSKHRIQASGISPHYRVKMPKAININRKLKLSDEGEDVLRAEEALSYLGYYRGTPDQVFASDTVEAIMDFQKDQGLYPYPVIDFTTQNAINDALYESLKINDPQLDKAIELIEDLVK